jgi:hypothetical protein
VSKPLVDHVLGLLKGVANVDGVIWLASWERIEDNPYAPAVSPCVEDSDVPTKFGVRFVFGITETKSPIATELGRPHPGGALLLPPKIGRKGKAKDVVVSVSVTAGKDRSRRPPA